MSGIRTIRTAGEVVQYGREGTIVPKIPGVNDGPGQARGPKLDANNMLKPAAHPVAEAASSEQGQGIRTPGCCRLGDACTRHKLKKPDPFIPRVDEWDLLPDA